MAHEISIPLDQRKTKLRLSGALLFVLFGILFIVKPFAFIRSDDPSVIRTIGYIFVAFFGIISVFLTRFLFSKKGGLKINEFGVIDNSSGVAAGTVLWKDVCSIYEQEVSSQKFIMIEIKDPEAYIQRQHNPLKRRAMELNYQIYKTPICISANFLSIEFEELKNIILKEYQQQRN